MPPEWLSPNAALIRSVPRYLTCGYVDARGFSPTFPFDLRSARSENRRRPKIALR